MGIAEASKMSDSTFQKPITQERAKELVDLFLGLEAQYQEIKAKEPLSTPQKDDSPKPQTSNEKH